MIGPRLCKTIPKAVISEAFSNRWKLSVIKVFSL